MGMLECKHCHTAFEAGENAGDVLKCPHCNGAILPSETETELPPGFVLGGFEIVKLLGRGGMGNVYVALQVSMQRHVALKVLPKAMTRDGAQVMKFLNEVKNSGRLQHSNIVSAIDAGEDNGTYFLAMQYVAGETLEAKIDKDKRVPESDALDYALMIADALKYAWDRQNIFHKDIKPGNIIIDNTSGEAFLLDMGISQRIGEGDPNETHIEGSPFYMSPEQSRGEKLDWSTDLYSLGATLYNAIVGVPPFDDKDVMRIVEMHSTEPFPDPAKRSPESKVNPGIVRLLKKMMGKKPADRHKSWDAFIKDCSKVRKDLGARTSKLKLIKSHSPAQGKPYVPKKSSSSALIFVNVLLFLAVLGAGGFFAYKYINKTASKAALEKAEDYISRPGFEFQTAMELFSKAKETSERLGVPADTLKRASDGYAAIKSAAERRAAEQDAFESAMKVATIHFSKAKELHLQAKEAVRLKQTDGGSLSKAMDEAKLALKGTSGVSSDDTKESQRLEQFKDAVGTLIKQLDSDIAKKDRLEADSAAKRREKAEAEESARREAEAKERDAKAQLESYKRDLAKRKEELQLSFVIAGRKKDFEAARDRFSISKEAPSRSDYQMRREALAFDVWVASTLDKIDRASKVWAAVAGSGKKFAGKIFTVNGKSCTINAIEKDEIIYNGKEKIALSELSPTDMQTLLKRVLPQEGSSMDMLALLLADGNFEEAAACTTDSDVKKDVSDFAKTYIKARMQKAIRDRDAGKPEGLERLKEAYGSLPEYSEVEKALGLGAQ